MISRLLGDTGPDYLWMTGGTACMNIVFRVYADLQLQELERYVSFHIFTRLGSVMLVCGLLRMNSTTVNDGNEYN